MYMYKYNAKIDQYVDESIAKTIQIEISTSRSKSNNFSIAFGFRLIFIILVIKYC